jgi:hypothetical protein
MGTGGSSNNNSIRYKCEVQFDREQLLSSCCCIVLVGVV